MRVKVTRVGQMNEVMIHSDKHPSSTSSTEKSEDEEEVLILRIRTLRTFERGVKAPPDSFIAICSLGKLGPVATLSSPQTNPDDDKPWQLGSFD